MAGTNSQTGKLLGSRRDAGWQAQRNLTMLGARPGQAGMAAAYCKIVIRFIEHENFITPTLQAGQQACALPQAP